MEMVARREKTGSLDERCMTNEDAVDEREGSASWSREAEDPVSLVSRRPEKSDWDVVRVSVKFCKSSVSVFLW